MVISHLNRLNLIRRINQDSNDVRQDLRYVLTNITNDLCDYIFYYVSNVLGDLLHHGFTGILHCNHCNIARMFNDHVQEGHHIRVTFHGVVIQGIFFSDFSILLRLFLYLLRDLSILNVNVYVAL